VSAVGIHPVTHDKIYSTAFTGKPETVLPINCDTEKI
jgi:hypothetical protein